MTQKIYMIKDRQVSFDEFVESALLDASNRLKKIEEAQSNWDYRKILLAYLRTVLICEGVTYAKANDRSVGGTPCDELSDEEQLALDELDTQARYLENNSRAAAFKEVDE